MTNHEIIERMVSFFIAETGLGRLNDYDIDTSIAPNGVESCRNENGILYLAFMLVQAYRALNADTSLEPKSEILGEQILRTHATIKSLERLLNSGLYNRQPMQNDKREQHDNYIGICAISTLQGSTEVPKAMIKHWWGNFFCFNNIKPGKFDIKQFRQPGEVAVYYVTAEKRAPFFFSLWLFAGIFINAKKKEIDAAQARLVWLRLWILNTKGVKGFVQRFLYKKVQNYWVRRMKEKYVSEDGILHFGVGHPVTLLQEKISSHL